jgi:predicted Zn-dependent protease
VRAGFLSGRVARGSPLASQREPVGTLEVALNHAARLVERSPAHAAEQAREILKVLPSEPRARLILGQAERRAGRVDSALQVLEALASEQPHSFATHLELGLCRGETGRAADAVLALRRAVQLKPDSADAWRLLADAQDLAGDVAGADEARARYLKAATGDPRLIRAASALVANDIPVAEHLLRAHISAFPTDIAALRMLAEVAGRLRRYADSEVLLERCLELAPSFDAARHNYALVLQRQAKSAEALPHIEHLVAREPRNPNYRNLKAAILAHLGEYAGSISVYESVLKEFPNQPKIWMSYGHSLKTAGRQDDCIAAYRQAIAMDPKLGESYWSLANLKTFRFSDSDVAAMQAAVARTDLNDEERLHFDFALGKALEDRGTYADSFRHYANGNALRRKATPYSAAEHSKFVHRSRALYTKEFFAQRSGQGAEAPDPIFILGLPRSGSTLLEQILASHSMVEGTMELPDLPRLVKSLMGRDPDAELHYPNQVGELALAELRALGERYLAETRVQRKTGAPFFIDKMPNNWEHVGLIHLILPNAKIIDARRHPLGCCLSAFKQNFARGQSFSYALEDLGSHYARYVELTAHFDAVLPGRVHRVHYEQMIADTEAEVRRLLDYCRLPFEPQCLKFYETERPVRTASSEQVRQPIFRDGLDQWRHYEPWLGPLKVALGPVLDAYPAVPEFTQSSDHSSRNY